MDPRKQDSPREREGSTQPPGTAGSDDTLHQATSRVRGALDELESRPELHELRERFDEVFEGAARFIRANPAASLVIAAGVGYLIGRVVRS